MWPAEGFRGTAVGPSVAACMIGLYGLVTNARVYSPLVVPASAICSPVACAV